jgi:hypothetical protein
MLYIAFGNIGGFTQLRYVLERITREYGGTPVYNLYILEMQGKGTWMR